MSNRGFGYTVRRALVPGALAVLMATSVALALTFTTLGVQQDRDDEGRDGRRAYAIGLWGDLPYSDLQALAGVPNLIGDMNEQDLAFTVHDGDLKAGNGTPGSITPTDCIDALYDQALGDRKSTRLNSSHIQKSRMPSSA